MSASLRLLLALGLCVMVWGAVALALV